LVNLDRLAEDLQVWATQEFHLVELADEYSRTSVIMPQKKNPYSLAYVRGLANVSIGGLAAMANVGRTPSGQPDSRIFAYGDVPRTLERTREAVELMGGVVATLSVNPDRMAERAGLGYTQATDLAEEIMRTCRVPYQSAHRLVGHLVAQALEDGVPAEQITPEMVDQAAQTVLGRPLNLSPAILAEALDPRAIVATRSGIGGAASAPMEAMIEECHEGLRSVRAWRVDTGERIRTAQEALLLLARREPRPQDAKPGSADVPDPGAQRDLRSGSQG
jgi:argininosuccinate lyase